MGYIPDLEECDWWHSPGLAYDSALPEQFRATMVGWLGNEVTTSGEVSGEILEKLEWACQHLTIDQGWLGEHRCELCQDHTDRGEMLILYGSRMYVAPRMILHYIKAHAYLPPEEFLKVMQALEIKLKNHEKQYS